MSQRGTINALRKQYKDFIQQAALRGMLDNEGNLLGTRKINGYVAKIHTEGDLIGTVDVQEFNYESKDTKFDDWEYEGAGYHEGVKLCATKTNEGGVLIVPLLFSEVIIAQNPSTQEEYIIEWSHAEAIQLKSHKTIHLGVTEYEDFVETEDGLEKDYDELDETGKKSFTDYTAELIRDEVSVDGEGLVQEKTSEQKKITVGNTTIIIDGENVTIETSGNVKFTVGGSCVDVKDGIVDVTTDTATVKGSNIKVDGEQVEITGGNLTTKGTSNVDLNGPFNAVKVCPFSGAPHCGSKVSGT